MSKPSIDALKKLYAEQKEKKEKFSNGESPFYPFWNMNNDEVAMIRLLEIKNPKSALPFLEKDQHKLSINGKDETFPCPAMYGETCPVCELAKKYYGLAKQAEKNKESKTKIDELKELGKYYYRSRAYLGAAYIVKDPLPINSETGTNDVGKVKAVQFGNQLYNKFNTQLETLVATNQLEALPWDLTNGLDFMIVKKTQGNFAKYDVGSEFVRRHTSLPEDFVQSFEPFDLSKYLPNNIGNEKVQRMLDAHLNGSIYDPDDNDNSDKNTTTTSVDSTPVESTTKPQLTENKVSADTTGNVEIRTKVEESVVDDDDDEIKAMLRQLRHTGTV